MKPVATSIGESEQAETVPIGSLHIRALLNRHGIAPMRHVTTIADVLAFGYTLVHRRMNGAVAWELEEIEKVAKYFGETLADVFGDRVAEEPVPAMLVIGAVRIPCQLFVGNKVREPLRNDLVASRIGEQWLVIAASEAVGSECFVVSRMVVTGYGATRWRIAVLDDDATEAASLAQHLSDRGCDVQAFTRVADIVFQLKLRPFDGYVIDWVLEEGSAAELVGMIRADDRNCPIAVLTGKLSSDVMLEPAVSEAVSTYRLLFFEKPTRLAIISAQLLQSLTGK